MRSQCSPAAEEQKGVATASCWCFSWDPKITGHHWTFFSVWSIQFCAKKISKVAAKVKVAQNLIQTKGWGSLRFRPHPNETLDFLGTQCWFPFQPDHLHRQLGVFWDASCPAPPRTPKLDSSLGMLPATSMKWGRPSSAAWAQAHENTRRASEHRSRQNGIEPRKVTWA